MELIDYIAENALALIPALVVIGLIAKRTAVIPDKLIPLILLAFGVAGALLLMLPSSAAEAADAVVQGILAAGAAVFGNQLVKQLGKEE